MNYYVYILTNRSRTLYTGVTNDLERRIQEHKAGARPGFTKRYHVHQLAFYERFTSIRQAIAWEKRIKGWTRAKKLALIEERNPQWRNLAADWFTEQSASSSVTGVRDPSLHPSTGSAQDDGEAFGSFYANQ